MRKAPIKVRELANRYLTVEEVAVYLSFDVQTIWKWAREGTIPCSKLGNKYRFRIEEVDEWVDTKKQRNVFGRSRSLVATSQISGQRY